jgi:hypothetical protein
MTVKELKEQLNKFPDSCIVMIPNIRWGFDEKNQWSMVPALHVSQGINELDGIVLIDDYVEDDEDE